MNFYMTINSLFPFLILGGFYSSCNTQVKPKPSTVNLPTNTPNAMPLNFADQLSEYVVEVFEDSKGNLWFGTISDGAAKYDGNALTYISTKDGLCDNTIVSVAEDSKGNMWFGTHDGASKYDGKTFTSYKKAEGLTGVGCKLLIDSRGKIWAGTNDGAFLFNGIGFAKFSLPNPVISDSSYKWVVGKIWDIKEDTKGNIWFARDGLGACKYDGNSFTHYTKNDGLCSNNVSRITEDKAGNIWLATLTSDLPKPSKMGGLNRFDGKKFKSYPEIEGLTKNDIYSIYSDKKGNVWIGATGLGVYRYDGTSFKLFKGTDRMDLTWSVGIQSICEDKNGTIWFGFSGGLFKFDGNGIVNIDKQRILK